MSFDWFRNINLARLPIWASCFVGTVCIAVLVVSAWHEWDSRKNDLKNAEVGVANLARSLTQHAEDTFELADSLLLGLVQDLETGGTAPQSMARIQAFLNVRKPSLGRIRALFVYDEAGRWLATTESVDLQGRNNSDRDYFNAHKSSGDRHSLIGRPIKSRAGGQWIMTASRRFNHPDGSFAGVVLATIDVAYFSEFYSKFDVGAHGSISLLSRDGILLARGPHLDDYVGRDMSSSPLVSGLHSRPDASIYYFKSPLDGIQRLSFYRISDRYPLMVLAARAQEEVLAPWKAEATTRLYFVFGLTALIAFVGFFLIRQMVERQRIAAALLAKEADFRLLAEESSDMVMRIGADEIIRYVSPSSSRVLGWRPDQLVGTPAFGGINPHDRDRVERTVTALKSGEIDEARLLYRNRHRDRKEIWIETTLRATRKAKTGEIDGVVGISRDMTEHKDLQDKLAALATLDGLTGLANRRYFDDRSRDEWARAKRDGTPLSLLLIDVDHFKKYNDRYGHQTGDECLRSVARAVAQQARRPADLAARYGGEEFALLLPNTDMRGCEQVGEALRKAVSALGIPHSLNIPTKIVTVSVGGAISLPAAATSGELNLMIDAADRALYAAKRGGRDRFEMSGQVITLSNAKSA